MTHAEIWLKNPKNEKFTYVLMFIFDFHNTRARVRRIACAVMRSFVSGEQGCSVTRNSRYITFATLVSTHKDTNRDVTSIGGSV